MQEASTEFRSVAGFRVPSPDSIWKQNGLFRNFPFDKRALAQTPFLNIFIGKARNGALQEQFDSKFDNQFHFAGSMFSLPVSLREFGWDKERLECLEFLRC